MEEQQDIDELEELLNKQIFQNSKPLKTLAYLFRGNMNKIILSFFVFVVKHSPVWIIPIVTGNVIDIATKPEEHQLMDLWMNIGVVVLLIVQNVPNHVWYSKLFSQALRSVEANIRGKMVRKLQILSISYHKQLKSGKIQSKILRDVDGISVLSRQLLNGVLPMVLNIVVGLGVTMYKSITVALFFIAAMPISFLIIRFFRKSINNSNRAFRKEIEEMSATMAEMVEMVPVTRAHGLENVEIERVDEQLERVKNKGYYLDVVTSFFGASTWASFQTFQVACLAFTGYLAYKGKITVGDVVLYQSYFGSILSQVSSLINVYPDIVRGFESLNSVGEVFLSEDIEDNKGKKKIKNVRGEFQFCDVEFSYPDTKESVLNKFSLDVKAGECIAFVGESGAGKTTILNLVIGFNLPTGGKILIDGQDLMEMDLNSYRQHLAVVPQNTILFSGSIRDNIAYGLQNVDDATLKDVIAAANLTDVIEKLPNGLDTTIGEHGGLLSGGQRQRIAIARALIRDPHIIVLDEATSALDNISEQHVQNAMRNLSKGRTTFIVAHRLSTIKDADRIVVVKNGQCAEVGTYQELMDRKGEFYELEKLQS